ncbi:unnamed protein product, partial [Porites lobata]
AKYESDELASGSEDEKRLKKAREAPSRKRRQKKQLSSDRGKKPRIALGADNQLFRDPSYFVYSDASATGGGAIIDFNNDLCTKKCGRRTREFKVPGGGSCLLLSFHCNHLPQCWEDHTLSSLLIAKKLLRLLKWAA